MAANGPGSTSTEQPDSEAFVSDDRATRHVHRAECQCVAMLDPPVLGPSCRHGKGAYPDWSGAPVDDVMCVRASNVVRVERWSA